MSALLRYDQKLKFNPKSDSPVLFQELPPSVFPYRGADAQAVKCFFFFLIFYEWMFSWTFHDGIRQVNDWGSASGCKLGFGHISRYGAHFVAPQKRSSRRGAHAFLTTSPRLSPEIEFRTVLRKNTNLSVWSLEEKQENHHELFHVLSSQPH